MNEVNDAYSIVIWRPENISSSWQSIYSYVPHPRASAPFAHSHPVFLRLEAQAHDAGSAGPGGRAACAPAQGPGQKGAQTQVYTCIMYTAQPKTQRGRQAASRTIIVGTAIWQRRRQASAIWHRDRARLSAGESVSARRTAACLVWGLGVSRRRTRHWPP